MRRCLHPFLLLCLSNLVVTAFPAAGSNLASLLANDRPQLRLKPDGTFHISVMNDLHYGEGQANPPSMGWGPINDRKTTGVINTILDAEHPDLVVLNGDLITGENTYAHNATAYLDQVVDPIVRRNIHFATTYGNHDADRNISPEDLFRREKSVWPGLSLTERMVSGNVDEVGVSNYFIPIYGTTNSKSPNRAKLILWFFDSRCGVKRNGASRDCFVHNDVVKWFQEARDYVNTFLGQDVPSLAFVHIPVQAMTDFQRQNGGINPQRDPGLNEDNPAAPQAILNGRYTGADLPFLKALAETKGMMAVFSGHDHGNDWCHRWDPDYQVDGIKGSGITFCFGRHTGYGGYGKWMRGSRQILLREENLGKEFDTWMTLENREHSGHVKVNGRYGKEMYPMVKKLYSS